MFKLGCDPEFFVKRDGKFVAAHNLVPGTKVAPFKVDKGAVQVDGCALEFNIEPATNADEFVNNTRTVLKQLLDMVPDYEAAFEPVANFDPDYFATVPDEAKELGCEPDYNAYTGTTNPRPEGDRPFRTASGHIHIGWTNDVDPYDPVHFADCCEVVKQLDYSLGLASLLWDTDNTRRSLYGKAGAFRPKSYGVEYRVLSNRWLASDALMKWVFNRTTESLTDLLDGKPSFVSRFGNNAQRAIDRGNTRFAMDHWNMIMGKGVKMPPKIAA